MRARFRGRDTSSVVHFLQAQITKRQTINANNQKIKLLQEAKIELKETKESLPDAQTQMTQLAKETAELHKKLEGDTSKPREYTR